MPTKKDNSTLKAKVALRLAALANVPADLPVLETHGGNGRIFERCYCQRAGVVIEKATQKAEHLAIQRPSWRVYQGDCVTALAGGIAKEVCFGLIDVDPYGTPWPVLEALFAGVREWPSTLMLVVNDGLRNKLKMGGAWHVGDLRNEVCRWGNNLYPIYLDVAKAKLQELAHPAGFVLTGWAGYYCGHGQDMTHYWATLQR